MQQPEANGLAEFPLVYHSKVCNAQYLMANPTLKMKVATCIGGGTITQLQGLAAAIIRGVILNANN